MRAFAIDRFGDAGFLRDLPDPICGPAELLVRINVAGVNPVDWKIRDGQHGERTFPLVLGVDFAGVVEATGIDAADFVVGDRIFGAARTHGSYAERTVVPADSNAQPVAKVPAWMSDAQAAALPIAGLTALATLARLNVPKGESLLVFGGTGGVGAFVLQIARSRGIHVIATARSSKTDAARALGADEVIAYDTSDVINAVKSAHPDGITGVIDLVSTPDTIKRLAEVVRPGGRIVSPVFACSDPDFFAAKEITATNLAMGSTPQSSRAGLEELVALIEDGSVVVHPEPSYALKDAGKLLADLKAGKVGGNLNLAVTA